MRSDVRQSSTNLNVCVFDPVMTPCDTGREAERNDWQGGLMSGVDKQRVPLKQYALPQTSWSVGTGVHIPVQPQTDESSPKEQPLSPLPGASMARPYPLPQSLLQQQHDTTAYSSALQKQIAQASRQANLPLTGQYPASHYPFSQASGRYQQPIAGGNDAQLQSLLSQFNQTRQRPGIGSSQFPAQALPQQAPSGLPATLQAQLAQAREQARGYPQSVNPQSMSNMGIPSHLHASVSSLPNPGTRYPSSQQLHAGLADLTPSQYQALLRAYPGQQLQLDQLLRSTNTLNPGVQPNFSTIPNSFAPAPVDPLQAYLHGGAGALRGPGYGTQTMPSAVPAGGQASATLQHQLRMGNWAGQKPPIPVQPSNTMRTGPDFSSASHALPPSRSPGPYGLQGMHQGQDKGPPPSAADLLSLQQLLTASGKEISLDTLLQLQRELAQQRQAEAVRPAEHSDNEVQHLLASLGSTQQHQPIRSNAVSSGLHDKDAIAKLQRQLSSSSQDQGRTDVYPRVPGLGSTPASSAFGQEQQPGSWSQALSGTGRPSSQSEIGTGGQDRLPVTGQSLTPTSLQHPPTAGQAGASSLLNAAPGPQPASKDGLGRFPRQQAGLQGSGAGDLPAFKDIQQPGTAPPESEPVKPDWGPFTGLSPAPGGTPWSQPWSSSLSAGPLKNASSWGHSLQGMATVGSRSGRQTPVAGHPAQPSSSLGGWNQAPDAGNHKSGDSDWQAQLASLQNASRNQQECFTGFTPRASTDNQNLGQGGGYGRSAEQQLGPEGQSLQANQRTLSSSSLFNELNKRPDSQKGSEQDPMIPSWLQTTSQGSGVWGAPSQQHANASGTKPCLNQHDLQTAPA